LEKPSILVGIPHRGDLIDARFDVSLLSTIFSLAQAGLLVEVKKAWGRRETLDQVRNLIIHYFLEETKHTHLFFLDDDVLLLKGAVERLLACGLPIVSGLYYERDQQHRPIIINTPKNAEGKMLFQFVPLAEATEQLLHPKTPEDAPAPGCVRVDVVPGGCLLLQRQVLEQVKPPWFHFANSYTGEDVYFSLHAAKAGFPSAVNLHVETLHITTHVTGRKETIEAWENEFGFKQTDIIRS